MPLAGKSILIVSADAVIARTLADASSREGASVTLCSGGQAALDAADARGADAAVVDLPLADFRPDALLLSLRRRGIKIIAVSGVLAAARYAATALRFGAEAFLEKPADVQHVLTALRAALLPAAATATELAGQVHSSGAPGETPTASPAPSPADAASDEDSTQPPISIDIDISDTMLTETSVDPEPSGAYPLADDLDSYVFSEALPALDESLSSATGAQQSRREGLAAPLPATSVAPAARRPGSPELPEGDLATTTVPRLLFALRAARTTGALTLAHPPVKKLVLLEEGRAVFAASNVPSERFAARCVREGILGVEALEVLAAFIGPKEPLNEALLARGLLDDSRRTRMFAEQIRDILWSTFEWRAGSYRLLSGPRARRPIVRVHLPTIDLIVEGLRRVGTLEYLREELPAGLALAPAPGVAAERRELPMSEQEARLLSLADGTKTVSDLVVLSGMDERSALAFLAGCRAVGILDEVRRALAGTGRIGFM